MLNTLIPSFRIVMLAAVMAASISQPLAAAKPKKLRYLNYPNCIELSNGKTRVVLCPDAGGRVLVYEYQGTNALYVDEGEKNWKPGQGPKGNMSAGRFDIGPEKTIPRHPVLWAGKWEGTITGPDSARLVSQKDKATGVQLTREFRLDPSSTRLDCTQTITNVSNEVKEWCHWSRTFAVGHGICVIPLSPISRFPHHYVQYETGDLINISPEDPDIRQRYGYLEIMDVPDKPKLGMDSSRGWFSYLMPNDLMFVKRFSVDRDRVYNEAAGLTISIWYPEGGRVELEPIGPREHLEPGQSASFTESWFLVPYKFPNDRKAVDLGGVSRLVEKYTVETIAKQ